MTRLLRTVAAIQVALVCPACLFLASVLVATGDPPQYDLARLARRIVASYAGRGWTLWVLLLALPAAVCLVGCATLVASWRRGNEALAARPSLSMIPAPLATLIVAGTTLGSAAIMAVVVLHMLAN